MWLERWRLLQFSLRPFWVWTRRLGLDNSGIYDNLLEVEKLETLMEDLEEAESQGKSGNLDMDGDLQERMRDAGVSNIEELRARIASLHSKLDTAEGD